MVGVALNFPANDDETTPSSLSPPRKSLPRRLRQRLLAEPKTPLSAEHIEAKLKEADLRRQQFYELLSSKAKPKSKSPPLEGDLAQRLEARLNAAEHKRLNILSSVQMRLARLDELRQAAKSGAERRFEKERNKLGIKIESRVQQAEAKRTVLLKAYMQRRASKRERAALSMMRKISQENKYKERVRAAIYQKRAAAERKRLGLLEAERRRAHTRVLQAQRKAQSVYSQREYARKQIKDQLEDRLKRANRQRAEYLRQRRNLISHLHANSNMIHEQEYLLRKLARYWRCFVNLRKTTFSLAKSYVSLEINAESVKSMPFDQLALCIKSATAIKTVKALVDRLESRFRLSKLVKGSQSSLANIDHLLRLIAIPNHKVSSSNTTQSRGRTTDSTKGEAQTPIKLSRYPVKVVLCAYMIIGQPDAIFNVQGECEITLADSAINFIREFELLVKIIVDGPIETSQEKIDSSQKTFRSQLDAFDKAWCTYLHHFVSWKLKDAKLLEEDLVTAACQLEISMLQTSHLDLGDGGGLAHDIEAIKKQVLDEQKHLREKLLQLSGTAGLKHMEFALADIRSKSIGGNISGTLKFPIAQIAPSCQPDSSKGYPVSISAETSNSADGCQGPSGRVDSLVVTDYSSPGKETVFSSPKSITDGHQSSDPMLVSENELLVSEIIHEHRRQFADSLKAIDKDENSIEAKVKMTMERAFWDSITESIKQDKPDFSWILKLMKEVRNELCEMSPQTWRQEIMETIDVDILSEVLKSGTLDMDYLGKILEFALVTLQKLSAPANDEEMRSSHNKLLKDLREMSKARDESNASFPLLVIKGLRFVLQEIQMLKQEITKAHIRFLEPLIKGPAGLEYLRRAFANQYGPPTDASSSLTLTRLWFSSVHPVAEQEWEEHQDSLSAVASNIESSQVPLPTTLRTGGTFSVVSKIGSPATGFNQLESKGERVDKLLRLGILKLVSGVGGLTLEALPETLKHNLFRLRAVQSQHQKIIVISTSMLILRQMIMTEKSVTNSLDMEKISAECVKQLSELLDKVEDVGISEIAATISGLLESGAHVLDTEKLQSRKKFIENMLGKSLQAEDPIFLRVSRCVYLALRGAVFGGSGYKGKQLVGAALQRVGAALLADRVMEAAEILIVVATVSRNVHGAWYQELLKNM